ncbi:MAG: HTTM domain-containing protein [Candidatus Omnitrophica bacterium]|nr:HTTM domain-containing protein [Candidatus Omnitrophota bacterium]
MIGETFKKFHGFWFGGVLPQRLNLFERVFTFTFLLYMIERFRYAGEWLTDRGFHLTARTKSHFHVDPFPLMPEQWVPVFGVILFGSALSIMFQWQRRVMIWILFFCAVYVQNVDAVSAFTLNKYYIVVFLLLAISPRPQWITDAKKDGGSLQSVWVLRTLQATLLIAYFTAGTCKLMHGDWLHHTDTLWTQVQGIYRTDAAAWMLRALPKWTWAVQMYAALIFELTAPILFAFRKTRPVAFIWGIGFHLLIALTMHQLIYFSIQLMTFYILFLPEETITQLNAFFKIPIPSKSRRVS